MINQRTPNNAHFRLANHYIGKLKQANTARKRGSELGKHWNQVIDKDWAQIKQWQQWSTSWTEQEPEKANVCVAFATASGDILGVRLTPEENVAWLEPALKAAQKFEDGTAEREILVALGFALFSASQPDEATKYLHHLIQISEKAQDDHSIGRARLTLGSLALQRGDFDSAEANFHTSLEIFEKRRDVTQVGRTLHRLGQAAEYRGDYQRAFEYRSRYLSIVEGTGREGERAVALISLCDSLLLREDFETALNYARRAVEICKRIGYVRMLAPALLTLGSCEMAVEDFASCIAHYKEAVEHSRLFNMLGTFVNGLHRLGGAYVRMGEYRHALDYLNEALAIAREKRWPIYIFVVRQDMTHAHIALGNLDAAQVALHEAIQTAIELDTEFHKATIMGTTALLWHKRGRHQQSATWAGMLMQYRSHLEVDIFNAMCGELEEALGTVSYHATLEAGRALQLDEVFTSVLQQLGILAEEYEE